MRTVLFTKDLESLKTAALVVGVYEGANFEDVEKYEALSSGLVSELVRDKELTGKFGKILMLRLKGDIKKLIFLGLGKKEEFTIHKARELAGKSAVYLRDLGIKEFALELFEDLLPYDVTFAVMEGVRASLYTFNDYKTQKRDEVQTVEQFTLVASAPNFMEIDEAIKESLVVLDTLYYVRDLQNKPSNLVTPTYLATEAKKIAQKYGLTCKILEKKDMEKLGMGGILAVNKGSSHPPKFIVLEYRGGKETICFVGKGITFDSGGISLKSAKNMDEMKFDMSGGAVVLGILQAAARLKLPYKIIGLVPTTENLPGGNAYKPGDIITFSNGKTSEIINTDAEGRLILADALVYSKQFNPIAVLDFATLTGACVVSLGEFFTGVFSNDTLLFDKINLAGEKVDEQVWRLPLSEKYKDYIKSNVADIKNCGPSEGGAITAALFLQEFVDCKKWAHLDIAGTAYTSNNKDVLKPMGGTGVGLRLALQLLKDWKK